MSRNIKDLQQIVFNSSSCLENGDQHCDSLMTNASDIMPHNSSNSSKISEMYCLPVIYERKNERCLSCPHLEYILYMNPHHLTRDVPNREFDFSNVISRRSFSCDPLRNENWEEKNFDVVLSHMTMNSVSNFLVNCNKTLTEMRKWCLDRNNFLHFSNFWLTKLSMHKKLNLIMLEYDYIRSQIQSAINTEIESGLIPQFVFQKFLAAIFPEYPLQLLSFQGSYLFLNYLNTLISERTDEFRKLLSNVHCITNNQIYISYILGVRAFAIVSFWFRIVKYFQNLSGHITQESSQPHFEEYIFQAVKLGYLEVLRYLLDSETFCPLVQDSHQRTLVMSSILHHQPNILKYLLNRADITNANECADSGNSPLHAAVFQGDHQLLRILLKSTKINPDCRNYICDEATPLHIAIMLGDCQAIRILLSAGADLEAKMGDKTVWDLSYELHNDSVLALLKSVKNGQPLSKEPSTEFSE